MSQKDKIKLLVAVVVLLLAGVLIWYNMRESGPELPKQVPAGQAAPGEQQPAAPPVAPGGRRRVLQPS
jgi:hypothetical protein